MATQLRIKRGTTNANAPSGLTAGEMAINLVDKKLYVGGTAGTNTIFLDSTAVAGLSTANTFTALNTFSAGISASGATFSKDITVNTMTVGLGKSSDTNNVAIGYVALASNTSDYDREGTGNIAIGSSALTSNTTGNTNVGVGSQALVTNTTGSGNVGVGQSALYSNSTGSNNVGVGTYALLANITGSNKTALGVNAGRYRGSGVSTLTTGTGGIYIGYQARGSADTQTNEIVIGVNALGLGSNTAVIGATLQSAATIYGVLNLPSGLSASGATFSGSISGATATFSKDITVNSMTVGFGGGDFDSNVVLGGQNALLDNTVGTYNIAIGGGALASNTEGTYNTAIGGSALGANIVGNDNIAIGNQALFSKATGSNNIAIGGFALWHAAESENNIAIGISVLQGSLGFGYNPGSYNIGIGADVLKSQTFTGNSNVAIGYAAGTDATTASQMTALGYQAGRYVGTGVSTLTTGTGGIYIGYQARAGGNARTNEIVIGVDARGLGSNTAVIGATLQSAATIYGVLNLPSGLSASGATFTGNISASNIVNSFNGATGTVTGVGTAVAGTGISVSGATGAVTITNIGVRTFNGFTGGITFAAGTGITFTASAGTITISSSGSEGITAGGANTFTALQTFSAGISASGATFTGLISGATATFSKDITVNSMTVGRGGGGSDTNVAVGLRALNINTSGTENTALGTDALRSNSSGVRNTAIGNSALYGSTTRSDNTAIGYFSMAYLGSIGSFNVGIGTQSLSSVFIEGSQNVAVGYQSLKSNSSGANNVGMGYQSLFSDTTGLDNTGIGTNALRQNTTGSNNTAVGSDAGRYRGTATDNNTTGSGGIYIGYQARGSTLAQTNEIVIGVNAIGLGSNTAVIGATLQSAATIYGRLNLPSGLSAAGATFTGNISAPNIVSSFNGATGAVTGVSFGANTFTALNTFSAGISASGATFSAPITSTRMARHTSAAISAQKTVDFTPTTAEDGTVFYINYSGKGSVTVTLDGLPIGWRAKFLNVGGGFVYFTTTTGDIYGEGPNNYLGLWLMEAICIDTNTYFVG